MEYRANKTYVYRYVHNNRYVHNLEAYLSTGNSLPCRRKVEASRPSCGGCMMWLIYRRSCCTRPDLPRSASTSENPPVTGCRALLFRECELQNKICQRAWNQPLKTHVPARRRDMEWFTGERRCLFDLASICSNCTRRAAGIGTSVIHRLEADCTENDRSLNTQSARW